MNHWTLDPPVLVSLLVAGALYLVGAARLLRSAGRGRGVTDRQLFSFAAGWIALVLSLHSPIAAVSEFLFSVHMTQHEILMLVAAPLLVLARPLGVFVWALPASWRAPIGRWTRRPAVAGAWRALTGPLTVWVLHGAALWVWHLPSLYQAAVRNEPIHVLEHASFLGSALLFWWTAVSPSGRRRLPRGADVLYVFTGAFQGAALGALFTFASIPLYPLYAGTVAPWGLSPLQDQQLAGVIMWIPSGVVYLAAGTYMVRTSIKRSSGMFLPVNYWLLGEILSDPIGPYQASSTNSSTSSTSSPSGGGYSYSGSSSTSTSSCSPPRNY